MAVAMAACAAGAVVAAVAVVAGLVNARMMAWSSEAAVLQGRTAMRRMQLM